MLEEILNSVGVAENSVGLSRRSIMDGSFLKVPIQMAHDFWIAVNGLGYGLRAIILYFAGILKDLTWPQVFCVFLLLFTRQIKNLLVALNNLLEKMKTIRWGELKGELEETLKAVEMAAESQKQTLGNSEENVKTNEVSVEPLAANPKPNIAVAGGENSMEEYSRLMWMDVERQEKLNVFGLSREGMQRSPIERFLDISQAIENLLFERYFLYGFASSRPVRRNVSRMAAGLVQIGVITEETYEGLAKYQQLRNRIVHAGTEESEVIEAFLLGRRLYHLLQMLPLPEYQILEPFIGVSVRPEMEETLQDLHVVSVVDQKHDRKAYFLTTEQFDREMAFVPRAKVNDKLQGYFYFFTDDKPRRIYAQRLDFAILYSRK